MFFVGAVLASSMLQVVWTGQVLETDLASASDRVFVIILIMMMSEGNCQSPLLGGGVWGGGSGVGATDLSLLVCGPNFLCSRVPSQKLVRPTHVDQTLQS